jgi:hypothetical protein
VKSKPIYGAIGSVSSGTMRPQDLILSFLWEAKRLRLTKDERKAVRKIDSRVSRAGDSDVYWTDEVADTDAPAPFALWKQHE